MVPVSGAVEKSGFGMVIGNLKKHNRQSTRLKGYDYSRPGAYYVTICADRRKRIFGVVLDGGMELNRLGKIV